MKKPVPFGKYLLLERINVGGMAEVFMAKAFGAEGFERLLAIKKILPTMVEDEEFITMFLDEARISVQLNHANVVQIHELGRQDENFYIAMDYVAGKDLRTILERYRRRHEIMPTAQAAYLAMRMAEGLDYAHKKKDARGQDLNIVHRDVSPQNILVSFDGEVKIIDFGIAKAANRAQKTQAGILKGKFGYMSPEQVRGLPIDRRSDIFALGVVFYEMVTGEKLFVGESDFSTLEKVRNAEVPSPRSINSAIPAALEKVAYKALAREVEDRYQWAGEMAEDLRRILGPQGYSEPQMKQFMGEAFREDLMREQQRIESFADLVPPGPRPTPAAPAPQGKVGTRGAMSAAPVSPAPRPAPAPPPRPAAPASARRQAAAAAAPALDPVAAALAELDGGAPASAPSRPAPRVVTPPKPVAHDPAADLDGGATMFDPNADPNNPYIPPPSEEELAEMGTADRTVMAAPAFDENGMPIATNETGKKPLSMETVVGNDDQLAQPEGETQGEGAQIPPAAAAAARRATSPRPAPAPVPDSGSDPGTDVAPAVPAPRKSRMDLRSAPLPAQPPPDEVLTRARPPEPEPAEEEPREEEPPPEFGDTGELSEPPSDEPDSPEPTAAGPRRVPPNRRAPPPEVEPADQEPEPEPEDDGYESQEQDEYDREEEDPQPEQPQRSGGGARVGLIVGGSALGVVVLAGLGFLAYSATQATITVKVEPASASASAAASIDGQAVPLDKAVSVAAGEHEVSLTIPGQPVQKKNLTVSRGHPRELHFEIQREDKAPDAAAKPEPAPAPKPAPTPAPQPDAVAAKTPEPAPAPAPAPTPAPAPAPTPTPAAANTFSVRIETDPPGALVLFGKKKGDAPLEVHDLDRKKSYSAEARLKGYKSPAVPVKFDGNDPMTVTVHLEKEAEQTAVAKDPKPEHTEHVEKAKAPKGTGSLICSSNPVGKVFVDGKSTNRFTPIPMANPLKLPAGKHLIKIVDDGSGKSATATVTINPDETARLISIPLQ